MTSYENNQGYLKLLKNNKPFSFLFLSQIMTNSADGLFTVLVTFLALQMKISSAELGIITFCTVLPRGIFGFISGFISDRFNRRKVLIVVDLLRCLFTIAFLMLYISGNVTFLELACFTFIINGLYSFIIPASKSYLPSLTTKENLQLSNGLIQTVVWPAFFLGSGLAGILQTKVDYTILVLVNAIMYALSVFSLLMIRTTLKERTQQTKAKLSFVSDFMNGYLALKENSSLHFRVILYGVFTFFWRGILNVGLPLFITDQLHVKVGLFGILMAVNGIGEFIWNLVIGKRKLRNQIFTSFTGEMIFGIAAVGIAISAFLPGSLWFVIFFVFLIGIAASTVDIPLVTAIQLNIPEDHTGKAFSYWQTLSVIGGSLGSLFIGTLYQHIGSINTFGLSGIFLIMFSSSCLIWIYRKELVSTKRKDKIS